MKPSEAILKKLMDSPNKKSCATITMDREEMKNFLCARVDEMPENTFMRVVLIYAPVDVPSKTGETSTPQVSFSFINKEDE
jgi:hypothetical protein